MKRHNGERINPRYKKTAKEIRAENDKKVRSLLDARNIPHAHLSNFDAVMTLARAIASEVIKK